MGKSGSISISQQMRLKGGVVGTTPSAFKTVNPLLDECFHNKLGKNLFCRILLINSLLSSLLESQWVSCSNQS